MSLADAIEKYPPLSPDEFQRQIADEDRKARAASEADRREARQKQLENLLDDATVPRKFQSARIADLTPTSAKHQQVLLHLQQYQSALASKIKRGENLVLIGNPGTGKSTMACSILNEAIASGYSGLFTTVSRYFSTLYRAYGGRDSKLIDLIESVDVLVMDEVGHYHEKDDERRRERLFDLLNHRYSSLKPTILTGNVTPRQFQEYMGQRMPRRMTETGGRIVACQWASWHDYKSRLHLVEKVEDAD